MPYGPEVSWPSGFRPGEFDSGEYRALVESSYERDEYSHVDPRSGGDRRPGDHPYGDQRYGPPGGRAGGYRQAAGDDHGYGDPGYGDPGYGDPGYADPGYDGPRAYQAPARSDFRHPVGPGSAGPGSGPVGPEPIYPVTGAQEVYRDPEEPRYEQPRAVDPRLVGLRYDELRYDDAELDEPGRSRYDEPLDDEAWYAELRSSGPAKPQRPAAPGRRVASAPYGPAVGGPSAGGPSAGGPSAGGPAVGGHPAGGPSAGGASAGGRAVPGGSMYGGPGGTGSSGGLSGSGGASGPGGPVPGNPSARNVMPGNGPGPRMSALPIGSGPVGPALAPGKGLARNPGTAYKAASAVSPVRPQPAALAPPRETGFLGAPVAPVGVLTPPVGNHYDAGYTGQETVAWSMSAGVNSGEIEVLEEYWEQDGDDVEYSALLADLDVYGEPRRDTGSQPAVGRQGIGRRRGRSGDRRLWLGLGGVVAVAVAAIFLIIKFEFPSSGGPAHTLVMPNKIGSAYVSSKVVDKADIAKLRQEFEAMTQGKATDVLSGTYQAGGLATGGNLQIVMTIDAHLPNDNAAASISGFMQEYKDSFVVPAGPLGGEAACAESEVGNADDVSICAWFDNDSFGVVVSPSMEARSLAGQLQMFRSAVEHVAVS
jgi:hypothetical protein